MTGSATGGRFGPSGSHEGLEDLLDRIAEPDRPDDPALLAPDGRVLETRASLAARVRAYAGAYERAGIAAGDAVAFGVRQDADGIAWLLAALRAGVVVVVLDAGLAPGALEARSRTAGVTAVVMDGLVATMTGSGFLRRLAASRGIVLPDASALAPRRFATGRSLGGAVRLDRLAGGDAPRPHPADGTALVIFTSGTTESPRGVVHGAAGLAETLRQAASLIALGRGDRVLGTGLHLVGPALLAGAAVVVPPGGAEPGALARATREAGVTHASMPLHTALAWANAEGAGPEFRTLLLGSAPVRNAALAELVELLPGVRVASVYGLTEHLLVALVEADDRLAHDERAGDLVGRPLPGVRVRAAADGEIHVAGPALALGYLGGDLPVAELATGDLGRIGPDGRLVLLGRRKEMLIRRGQNIYPSLYEPALAAATDLEAAIMVGVEGADGDEAVVLFAVPHAGDAEEDARARLESLIASPASPLDAHARPDAVLAIGELPRAGRSGKPDRQALAAIAADHLRRRADDVSDER